MNQFNSYIVDFIYERDNWEDLLSSPPYCLKISYKDNYTMFKYNQIDSDLSLSLVQEARGIIVKDNFEIVSRPFKKFFNYGEPNAASINWNGNIHITEKIDGSLFKVWYDNASWHISTNGNIDAHDAIINDANFNSFGDLFEAAVIKEFGSLNNFYNLLNIYQTHCFELVSPYNRVVVPYDELNIYYLTSFDPDGNERPIKWAGLTPWEFCFESMGELLDYVSDLPWTKEGFVVFDGINRVKVKSPAYIKAHYARNNSIISVRNLFNIILAHEEDEFLVYAAEYTDAIGRLKDFISTIIVEASNWANKINYSLGRKDIAAQIISAPSYYKDWLFKKIDDPDFSFKDYVTAYWNANFWMKIYNLKN